VFSGVARRPGQSRLLRRGAFAAASTLLQLSLGALAVAAGRNHPAKDDPVVEVKFVRPSPPAPPPTFLPPRKAPPEHAEKIRKPRVAAVIQPKAIPEVPPPPPEEPEPEEPNLDPPPAPEIALGAAVDGALGGVVGGAPGGEGGGAGEIAPGPVDYSDEMSPPKLLDGPSLAYTSEALEHRVEGVMVVRCVLTAEGRVHGCRVLSSLPFMDQEVVAVLEGRRYLPATLRGMPLEVNYTFKIKLRLPR